MKEKYKDYDYREECCKMHDLQDELCLRFH